MILGVSGRNKRAIFKKYIYCRGTRIIPFCSGAVSEGEGCIVYSLCSLTPHLSGGQVSSNSYHLEHIRVSRSVRSWKIHVGKDLRDN